MLTKHPASRLLILLLALIAATAALRAQNPPAPAAASAASANGDEMIDGIQLPNNPATDVARFYEGLTGKTLILDSNLAGSPLSLVVQKPISRKEAIALIESTFILNGYSIVNVDDHTAKLLGNSKFPKSEAIPLYSDPSQLPAGEEIVSYFMPFRYLKAEDAFSAFQQIAPFHPNTGAYVAIPSVNAVVLTESAPLIRRLVALQEMIDVEGAKTVTEFFPLQRADADKVVEILSKIFEKDDAAANRSLSAAVASNGGAPGGVPPPSTLGGTPGMVTGLPGKVQVFADKRTNRVMVVAPEGRIPYIRAIIENFDSAVNFEEPLERPLRFVKAGEVLPVLASLLSEKDDKNGQPAIVGGQEGNGANANGANGNSNDSSYSGNGVNGSSGGPSVSTNTTYSAENTAPQSVIVGSARIIADRSVNKIIVIGPPESRQKAGQLLDMLDQRPKQVYLAVVIGQLTLGKNLEVGVNYLYKGTNPTAGLIRALGTGATGDISNLLANRSGSLDVVPDTSTVTDTAVNAAAAAASTAIPALSGLTVYGSIANSVDILARAMAATSKFQIISRPVVYTSNGQPAVISSGQSVPVASGTLTSAIDSNNNTNNLGSSIASNVEYKDIVLELEVQPLINSDHEVTLKIKQKNDTIQGTTTVSGNSYPTLGVQALNTVITVPNRNTVVLGGLISEQEDRSVTGIPLLKDIPGVGYLFSNTVKNKVRRELIIMIQPFIVDTDDKLKEVNYIERANTGFKEHLFDEPVPVKAATLPVPEELNDSKLR